MKNNRTDIEPLNGRGINSWVTTNEVKHNVSKRIDHFRKELNEHWHDGGLNYVTTISLIKETFKDLMICDK